MCYFTAEFYCSSHAGAPFSSPADFPFVGAELLLPARSSTSWFQLRSTRPHLCFCGIFHPLLRRVLCFLAALFAANLPPCACQFGCKLPVRQTAVFPPACCTLIRRVPCQHSCWFKSFHYVVLAVPVFVCWFEEFFADCRHIVQSSRFRISCTVVGSFFFFVGVPVRPIAG